MSNFVPTARVVARSESAVTGVDLITFELEYWKSIHGEFMTHRVFGRNASSSRAIPVKKLLVEAIERPSGPLVWTSEQKGMSGGDEIADVLTANHQWSRAAETAKSWAEKFVDMGVHKSLVNRLIEPFTAIRVVVSSTDWLNFFGLRLHKDAQPEMRMLAEAMWAALKNGPDARILRPGEWHLPYADDEETVRECAEHAASFRPGINIVTSNDVRLQVSVARCARVSYRSFETGKRSTIEEDLKVYAKLLGSSPIHASPAEHQATPDPFGAGPGAFRSEWGNLFSWRQFRKMLPNEDEAPLPEGYRAEDVGLTR